MGMWEALEGCRLKIVAASDHQHRLEEALDRFFEDKSVVAPISGKPNAQRTKYVFRVDEVLPYPEREWGIIIGDAIHCLRSALDQLAWAFAKEGSNKTAFPICFTEREWVVRAPAQYWSVAPGMVKLMDRVQPYHRGDPKEHPLGVLRTLSNLDKHRSIPTIAVVPDNSEAEVVATEGIAKWNAITFRTGVAYEKGAVVADCKIVPDNSGLEPYMDVHMKATFDVGFGDIPGAPSIRHRPVLDVISEIGWFITNDLFEIIKEGWNTSAKAAKEGGSSTEKG